MRTVKLIILAVILIAIVLLCVANRAPITLNLLPEGMSWLVPKNTVTQPVFVVILAAVLAGVVGGYLFEWLREHKHRRRANVKAREADELNREMNRLRRDVNRPKDDVLAIVGN